jgi:hypothetical protein
LLIVDAISPDVPVSADQSSESLPIVDAGECRGEASDLERLGWAVPCPSIFDAGVPTLSCSGLPVRIYEALCGQRQTLRWDWVTHGMICFYEQGSLVGLQMWNDTLAFLRGYLLLNTGRFGG